MLLKTIGFFLLVLMATSGCISSDPRNDVASASASVPTPPQVQSQNAPSAAVSREKPVPPFELSSEWRTMFDGKSLHGWHITDFAGAGEVTVEEGKIILGMGAALTGIDWTNAVPKWDYEIALEAMKVDGSDFFCGLTLPAGDSFFSFIVGGWGGGVVGISSVDGADASLNETTKYMKFDRGKWYRIRVRVTRGRIETWIDDDQLVDLELKGKKISLRAGEIELSTPLGVASWQTTAALRDIRIRSLQP
jgi:hypothetical protein